MAFLFTLETNRSFLQGIVVWVGVSLAFMLVGGWVRRRNAISGRSS